MNVDQKPTDEKNSGTVKVKSTSALTPEDKALLKFGEETLVKSGETAKDYAKTMITLITGLFAAYFAILKFLGIETTANVQIQELINIVVLPPVFFILSILSFVFAIIPLSGKMSLNKLEDIKKVRNSSLKFKIIVIAIGTSLFIIGLTVMLMVNLLLLQL